MAEDLRQVTEWLFREVFPILSREAARLSSGERDGMVFLVIHSSSEKREDIVRWFRDCGEELESPSIEGCHCLAGPRAHMKDCFSAVGIDWPADLDAPLEPGHARVVVAAWDGINVGTFVPLAVREGST